MTECEGIADELARGLRQFLFQLNKARSEEVHRREVLRLLEEIQAQASILNERLKGAWIISLEGLKVSVSQEGSSSPAVTVSVVDSAVGIIGVSYPGGDLPGLEGFILEVSCEDGFLWKSISGEKLTAATLAAHCLYKGLSLTNEIIISLNGYDEKDLRERLRKVVEAESLAKADK